ncbi:hypothetical protein C8Q70DRAFT_110745 [Cubamyces menziesii]|uniref:Uncharacterized protein n=1 Tax=Trametes cubensis TaxID=1111947 RepID=A0AAD7U0T7_9APHY|nr:hypothetical protein C8Q70DRAFT_110745 [Cubamyces menziesii]KAJ8494820.1 hypothetical protein ONZ51_g2088 [Trametes cubensis]
MMDSRTSQFPQHSNEATIQPQMSNNPDALVEGIDLPQLEYYDDCMGSPEYEGVIMQNSDGLNYNPAGNGPFDAAGYPPPGTGQLERVSWQTPQFDSPTTQWSTGIDNLSIPLPDPVSADYPYTALPSSAALLPQAFDYTDHSTQVNVPAAGASYMTHPQELTPPTHAPLAQDPPLYDPFEIAQASYKSPGGKYKLRVPLSVNISAALALRKALPATLDWTRPAFDTPEDLRTDKKFQVRFKFIGVADFCSKQHNEYSVEGNRPDARQSGSGTRTKKSPCSNGRLLHIVAKDLYTHMTALKEKGTPLRVNSFEVDFDDILIVEIQRVTKASVQPIIAILPEAKNKYVIRA